MLQDHRLEFNTKFRISPSCDTLYQYWNDKITVHLNEQFRELSSVGKGKGTGVKILLDCASAEYMKAIQRTQLDKDIHIVEIVLQHKGTLHSSLISLTHSLTLSPTHSLVTSLSPFPIHLSSSLLIYSCVTVPLLPLQEKSMQLMQNERGVCL